MSRQPPLLYILDVDGTLRWTTVPGQHYPLRSGQWRLMPGVAERLSAIPFAPDGPWLAVASNQGGVGEGLIGEHEARRLITEALAAAVPRLPRPFEMALCTCHPALPCCRRKPAPGLITDLLARYPVLPHRTLYVGDLPIDAEAADRAGVPFTHAGDFFRRGNTRAAPG